MVLDRAATTEPATRMAAETTMIFFLPYMSARRPVTGMATAAASRVAVMAQEVLAALVPRSCGSSDWIGMTRDCINAPQRLPRQSTRVMMVGENRESTTSTGTSRGGELVFTGWSF